MMRHLASLLALASLSPEPLHRSLPPVDLTPLSRPPARATSPQRAKSPGTKAKRKWKKRRARGR